MKNNVNRALRAKNNFNLFNRSEAQKNTLCASVNISNASPRDDRDVTETLPRRYGWAKLTATLTLLLTLGVGQMWGAATNFTAGECLFVQADGDGAWESSACVKLWFHNSGSSTIAPTWIRDWDGGKMFYVIVPSGTYSQVRVQRWASNCSSWWNESSDINHSARGSGKNVITAGSNSIAWRDATYTLELYGAPNSWASSLGTLAQTSGTATFTLKISNHVATATSYEFKVQDSYGGWLGSSNITLSGLVVGATYDINASFDLSTKTLTMTKTQKTFAVSTSATNGSVSPTSAFVGSSGVAFTATPNTGYHWSSWSTTSGLTATNANPTSLTATAAGTLTANFAGNTHSVTLDREGGTTGSTSVTATYGSAMPSATMPTKTGYDFGGYFTSAGGSGTKYYNANGSSAHAWDVDDDATIHAKWTEKTYNVTVTSNNFSYGTVMDGKTSAQTVSAKHFTSDCTITAEAKSGYRFTGWTYSGSVVIADASATSTTINATATGATVTANFEALPSGQLDIVAGANGQVKKESGSWGSSASYTDINTAQDLNIYAQANSGYHFDNWTKTGDGSIKTNAASGVYSMTARGSATVTANFAANTYNVTLNNQSATTAGAASVTATYNAAMPSIASNKPAKTGYDFNGYFGSTGGSGTKYYNANGTSAHVWDQTSAQTLYAYWTVHNYSITYSPASAPSGCTYTTTPSNADYNTTVSMTIAPSDAWHHVSVSVAKAGGGSVSVTQVGNVFSFTQPAANVTVTVTVTDLHTGIYLPNAHNSWNKTDANYEFKQVYGSSPEAAILELDINKEAAGYNTYHQFGGFTIWHNSWDTKEWKNSSTQDTKMTSHNCTDWGFNTSSGEYTSYFDLPVSGTYTLTLVNYSNSATQALSVTYPDKSFIEGNFPTAWNEDAYTLTDNGTTETVTINITSTGDKEFRLVSHGKLWGTGTKFTKAANSQTLSGKHMTESGSTMTLGVDLTGEYTFTYNKSTHNLTVTWPVYNQVRISAATTADATNVGNFDLGAAVSNVRSVTRSLKANNTYTFKVVYNSEWYGYNSGVFTRSNSTSSNSLTTSTSGGDMTVTTDIAGDYTFNFNQSSKSLSITYPTAYKITFGKGSVDGTTGSFSAVDLDNGNSAVTSNSTWVKSGNRVKITAPDAKSGYRFLGWYDNNSATGDAITTLANCTITVNTTKTVYACYAENLTSVTVSAGTGGTVSTGSGTHSVGVTTGVSINATANTGYSWSTWTTSGNAALGSSASTQSNTAKGNGTNGGTGTITATFTAKSYDVTLDVNGGSGANQTVTATYDAAMPTTLKGGESIAARTKTGYNFSGYAANADGSGTLYYTSALASNHIWDQDVATPSIYAKWTPKQSALSFDYQTSSTGYGSSGSISAATATYDAAMPALTGSMPTAANGYAFMGFYDETGGAGTQYYDGTGASVTNWDKDKTTGTTLYAYYKKAEITALTLSQSIVAPNTSGITVTPTINPTPVGTVAVCYEIQYNNGTSLYPQPEHSITNNILTFTAPEASDTYRIQATLNVTNCDGTELHSTYTTFQVAGSHTVTVQYRDNDNRVLRASAEVTAYPLAWSDDITAPNITGYTFVRWEPGDGVSIRKGSTEDTVAVSTDATVKIKAVYDGNLTAVYTKKRMIYFNNTLGWENVYVYFYKNNSYWGTGSDDKKGTGADKTYSFINTPYGEELYGQMTPIEEGSNIYYFDAEAKGVNASYTTVVFTELDQNGYGYFATTGDVKNKVIRRTDYNSTKMPMFVPLAVQTPEAMNDGLADYYWQGYWMNYPENTGYTLKIYDKISGDPAPKELYSYPFEFTADFTMPMELNVDLEAGQTYGFKIWRNDGLNDSAGSYYGNGGTMTANSEGWDMQTDKANCGLQTTAAGNYKFILNFYGISNDYQYRVSVTYPVAMNDYRIVYTDNATWSKGAHTASWNHPSRVITKNTGENARKDTVSFFWAYGSSPAIKFQTCTAVAAGSASWSAGTTINVSSFSSVLKEKGVYNFIFEQPAGGASISLVKVEPYTGNYYIRTDVAGNTKWSNYQALDHTMTYSDYAAANSGYSHYYAHWVTSGQNIKFTIANDYSPCISDTIAEDYGTTIADITTEGNDDAGRLNSGNANVRFMWNQSTNKISRAYISGSGTIIDRFLVLEGDSKMYDEEGHALTGDYQDADKYGNKLGTDNQVVLHDDENFVYERTIKVNATARARLSAAYNSNVQYFIGNDTGANWNDKTIQLLGGTYRAEKKYKMRIVYDFKTNRLVTAYLPDGDIDEAMAINADLMLVREHQDPAEQLTFTGDGELSEVKTVYGVMRFNRWTLNNKSTADGHAPLANPKSVYARALYWISFPFEVNLSDVFGFGTYGTHWIIEYYDGAKRAEKGFWKDSETFWTYVMPAERNTFKLEANKGYVLALELDLMKDNDLTFWTNNIENVELYFPSASNVGNIKETNAEVTVTAHQCTIDRTGLNGAGTDINKNRTKADSHWNVIGVPSYANYSSALTDGSSTITWSANPETQDLPFLYEWQETDNKLRAQSGTTYPFKVMHSYMVQYAGTLHWSLASATPQSVAARRQVGYKNNYEFRLEIQCNNEIEDQTFVSLRDNDAVTAAYDFGYDLTKEYNDGANIYTTVENYLPVAGNCLPLETEQVTTVPVGVTIKTAGEYTFAMPDGTEGMSVTLLDSEAGVTTDLSVETYQVELPAGTYENRFYMTIDPRNAATQIDIVGGEGDDVRTAKILRNGLLYIQRGDRIYDSTGRKLE